MTMKKKTSLLLIAIIIALPAITRSQDTASFHLGIGGSLNSVWIINQNMYGQPEIDYAPKIGGNVMIAAGYNFTQAMGLRVEPSFAWQGQKYDGDQTIDGTTYNTTRDIKLNYFLLPVLFRYTPGIKDNRFHLMVGPQLAVLVSAKQEYLRDGQEPEPFYSWSAARQIYPGQENIIDRYKSIDFMMVADVGMDLKLTGNWFMNIGFRITYGLTDINAEDWQIDNLDGEYKASHNFTAGLTAGFNWWKNKN
jgi:hypothetical protein